MGHHDTVGSLLADIANCLLKSLDLFAEADQLHWTADEHEQVQALEAALDEAKKDFQELGPLVGSGSTYSSSSPPPNAPRTQAQNGDGDSDQRDHESPDHQDPYEHASALYYEHDRTPQSLLELRRLRKRFRGLRQNFVHWAHDGGPPNPIWARQTQEAQRELHRAQCRAAQRVWDAKQEGVPIRCLGADLVARRLRRLYIRYREVQLQNAQQHLRTQSLSAAAITPSTSPLHPPTPSTSPPPRNSSSSLPPHDSSSSIYPPSNTFSSGADGSDGAHRYPFHQVSLSLDSSHPPPPRRPPLATHGVGNSTTASPPLCTTGISPTAYISPTSSYASASQSTLMMLHRETVALCLEVGSFQRFGRHDIAFICDFCDGHMVWEDVASMPGIPVSTPLPPKPPAGAPNSLVTSPSVSSSISSSTTSQDTPLTSPGSHHHQQEDGLPWPVSQSRTSTSSISSSHHSSSSPPLSSLTYQQDPYSPMDFPTPTVFSSLDFSSSFHSPTKVDPSSSSYFTPRPLSHPFPSASPKSTISSSPLPLYSSPTSPQSTPTATTPTAYRSRKLPYSTWQASALPATSKGRKSTVYGPFVVANHMPPRPGAWQGRLRCPYCFQDDPIHALAEAEWKQGRKPRTTRANDKILESVEESEENSSLQRQSSSTATGNVRENTVSVTSSQDNASSSKDTVSSPQNTASDRNRIRSPSTSTTTQTKNPVGHETMAELDGGESTELSDDPLDVVVSFRPDEENACFADVAALEEHLAWYHADQAVGDRPMPYLASSPDSTEFRASPGGHGHGMYASAGGRRWAPTNMSIDEVLRHGERDKSCVTM